MKSLTSLMGIGVGGIIALAIGVFIAWLLPDTNVGKQHLLCDRSVDELLHSGNLVEVVRSGFIVLRLECSISIRLTHEEFQ